ncbi:MAG TPA: hypothetical protein VIY72_00860, partial [Acidimicrobiales bacterium]
ADDHRAAHDDDAPDDSSTHDRATDDVASHHCTSPADHRAATADHCAATAHDRTASFDGATPATSSLSIGFVLLRSRGCPTAPSSAEVA